MKQNTYKTLRNILHMIQSPQLNTPDPRIFDELRIAILFEAGGTDGVSYTPGEISRCIHSSKLVILSWDRMDQLDNSWKKLLREGSDKYSGIRHFTEMTGFYLALPFSSDCKESFRRLLTGCQPPQPLHPTIARSNRPTFNGNGPPKLTVDSTEHRICPGYCTNVLRGCLAPPLIYLPNHYTSKDQPTTTTASIVPWQHLIREKGQVTSPIREALDAVLQSLNATTLASVVEQSVDQTRTILPQLIKQLSAFCAAPTNRTKRNENSETLDYHKLATKPTLEEERRLKEERTALYRLADSLDERLTTMAEKLTHMDEFMRSLEARYCENENDAQVEQGTDSGQADQIDCWNGETFGKYSKEVPEFNTAGQLSNPEVPITEDGLRISPPPFQSHTFSPQQIPPASRRRMIDDMDHPGYEEGDPEMDYTGAESPLNEPFYSWNDTSESSGYISHEQRFLPPNRSFDIDDNGDEGRFLDLPEDLPPYYPSPNVRSPYLEGCHPNDEECKNSAEFNADFLPVDPNDDLPDPFINPIPVTLPTTSTPVTDNPIPDLHIPSIPPLIPAREIDIDPSQQQQQQQPTSESSSQSQSSGQRQTAKVKGIAHANEPMGLVVLLILTYATQYILF